MDTILADVRHAARVLLRRPGFAVAAILSLAVGIAATTAVFSVVNGVLLKPVPGVGRPERLVEVSRDNGGQPSDLAYMMIKQLGENSPMVEELAGFALIPASVVADGEPVVRGGLAVTTNYFSLLGVKPARGRLFSGNGIGTPGVQQGVVISHDLWTKVFGAAPEVIGRVIRVNGYPVEVIGVLPPGFAGHHAGLLVDVFLPLGLAVPGLPAPSAFEQPEDAGLEVLGRLRQGVSRGTAATALSAAADQFAMEHITSLTRESQLIRVERWSALPTSVRGGVAAFLAVLSLLVGLALAMACTNVTAMLLARAAERRQEVAVRQALGASRARLTRQLVTEALVLFLVAGLVGSALAAWVIGPLAAFSPQLPVPGRLGFDFSLDYRVLAFSLAVTLSAGLLSSLTPAFRASRIALMPALKNGSAASAPAGRMRFRSVLVGLQVGLTTVLLIAGGLFANSLRHLRVLDAGWQVEDVQVLDLDLELRGEDREHGRVFFAALLERVRALPGIHSAALAAKLPLAGCSSFGPVNVSGVEPPAHGFPACLNRVSPGYFETLRLRMLRGHDFTERDTRGAASVAVINAAMAQRLWPDGEAVGQRFYVGPVDPDNAIEVVGVVANAKYRSLDETTPNFYYVPEAQAYNGHMILHARGEPGVGATLGPALARVIRELDRDLPMGPPRPLAEALELFFLPQQLAAWIAGVMGGFALLLAAVGVYGVTAYVVSGRRREFGIRLALGARSRDVLALVLRQGLRAPLVGMMAGIGVGLVFARLVRQMLSGIDPGDPVAFAGVPVLIVSVAALAIVIPVQRVLRQDPLASLRAE